jgi:CMP-N-acetylneuraminic acid synthetase
MPTPQPKVIALIPARGGSKRLPRKNLMPLAGKPLLAWTVQAARAARCIDRVILSTDDAQIAAVGRAYGAETPFMRPADLASDDAGTLDVMLHALRTLAAAGENCDLLVVLQPTSPLRCAADIDAAVELLRNKTADAVISVCETEHPPEWSNILPDGLSMADFFRPGIRTRRSQDLPRTFRLNGAIYVYSADRLLHSRSLDMDDNCFAYLMPRERSIDIDDALDFELAQLLRQRLDGESAV